jgi:glutathione synthase/RimK-type ligase-like ATP-grasp enzyme
VEASVFIFSFAYDPHATAVAWALRHNGIPYRFNPSLRVDVQTRLSLRIGETENGIAIDDIDTRRVRSAWHRRPKLPDAGHCLEADRSFIEGQWKYVQKGVFDVADALLDALWVNHPRAADYAESKLAQLQAARAAGLRIPDTLISNHAPDVAKLIQRRGKIVFKTFYPQSWQDLNKKLTYQMSVVALDATSDLPEQAIAMAPGIYQQYIDKVYDIRVTIIGCKLFAIRMKKASGEAYFDWRPHSYDDDMQVDDFAVSETLESQLRDVMKRLGIVFGCIDLVVDRQGDIYFLEVNQAGQFLFVEDMLPQLQTLRAMAAMLIAGSTHYSINDCVDIKLKDYLESDEYRELGSVPHDMGQRVATEPP